MRKNPDKLPKERIVVNMMHNNTQRGGVESVSVYVPSGDGTLPIAAGSGIVGIERGPWCDIWFEGNLYGAVNLTRWVERVACAAGRMTENYPTSARMVVPSNWLRRVGEYDIERGCAWVEDKERASEWSGEDLSEIEWSAAGELKNSILGRFDLAGLSWVGAD